MKFHLEYQKMTEEEQDFEEEPQDFQEEAQEEVQEEEVPEQPELKRQTNREDLKQRVNCPDCGRQVSLHCLRHTHRCKKMRFQFPNLCLK